MGSLIQTDVEDVTAPAHVAKVLARVSAERFTHLFDTFHQRTIRHGPSAPHLLDEFVFADQATFVLNQSPKEAVMKERLREVLL